MSALGIALLSIGLLLAGGGIGFYLARLGQAAETAKREEVETEFDAYRQQVTEHFSKTADQFHAIGQQYRELYDHLAEGSQALCQIDAADREPPFPLVRQVPPAEDLVVEEPVVEAAEEIVLESESDELIEDAGLVAAVAEATAELEEAEPEAAEESGEDEAMKPVAETDEEPRSEDVAAADEESADVTDAETPDNVVELIPRAEDEEAGDGERSIR